MNRTRQTSTAVARHKRAKLTAIVLAVLLVAAAAVLLYLGSSNSEPNRGNFIDTPPVAAAGVYEDRPLLGAVGLSVADSLEYVGWPNRNVDKGFKKPELVPFPLDSPPSITQVPEGEMKVVAVAYDYRTGQTYFGVVVPRSQGEINFGGRDLNAELAKYAGKGKAMTLPVLEVEQRKEGGGR